MTPTPSARDLQRASAAYKLASAMCVYCCAHHLDADSAGPRPTLANVPVSEAIDALSRMLQMQLGQPPSALPSQMTRTADWAWQLAEQVAENAAWNFDMFHDATRLGNEREQHHRDVADIRRLPETDEPAPGANR